MMAAFKYALRSLRKSPAFALTVIVSLGIGIGLNAAIFTVVDNVLLKPLGYHDADRIVSLRTHFTKEDRSIPRLGGPDYDDLVRQVQGLESVAYYDSNADGALVNGSAIYTTIAAVSPRFTQVMGVMPAAGRLLNPTDVAGTDALVSESFARKYLNGSGVGSSVTYQGALYTVVGVLPQGFDFPAKTELWLESPAAQPYASRSSYNYHAVGKRRQGVSAAALTAELNTFSAQLQNTHEDDQFKTVEAVSLQEQLTGRIRPTLNLLMGSVAIILLILCANITHLQLVHATRQVRGLAIRSALGAPRAALAIRAFAETLVLTAAGTVLALLLSAPAVKVLIHMAPANTPRLAEIHLNAHVLLFSFAVTLVVMLVTAMLPLWQSWRIDPASSLRADASRGTEARGTLRLRNSFIVAEVALTLTLSVAAVLLTRQMIALSHQSLGFQAESLVALDTHAVLAQHYEQPKNNTPEEVAAARAVAEQRNLQSVVQLNALLEQTAAMPGVSSAAAVSGAPLGFDGSDANYSVKGRAEVKNGIDLPGADMRPISPNFFTTLGIPLKRGRFLSADDRASAPLTVVINEALARQSFPGQDPIGQQIKFGYDYAPASWETIVGVVGDIHGQSPAILPRPAVYFTYAQHPREADQVQLLVRTSLAPAAIAAALTRTHPNVAVEATTMQHQLDNSQQAEHFRTALFGAFAAVSILLAALGMYGVTAYTVAQRRFEFGLRVALGANRQQLLTMVLRGALSVAALGIAIGIVLSLGLQRVLGSVIGALPAFDAVAYGLASVGVMVIALLATLLPARRAAGVDPMTVLRSD